MVKLIIILCLALLFVAGVNVGIYYAGTKDKEPEVIEVIKEVQTVVYRYPNTPPYEAFADPITFDQALVLLHGMRASHVGALNVTFEIDPGFGITDKELQNNFIKQYDQLIDIFWKYERGE